MIGKMRGGLTTANERRGTIATENTETSKRGRQVTAGVSAVMMVGMALIVSAGFAGAANGGQGNSDFTVLAGSAVTCTDATVVGDVGVWPGNAVTQTNCNISGSVHAGDGVAKAAYNSFLQTYQDLSQIACDQVLTTLDGQVLSPGVYCFDAAATSTDSTLTLNGPANGMWLFKIGTLGTGALTGTNFNVVLTGGADPCNVAWWVAEAATLTDSNFVGTIYAGMAITITRGTFHGDAFAKAAVTLTGTTVTGCEGSASGGNSHSKGKCNQGVGNGPENCDPGNSNQGDASRSNDELGGTPGSPGRQGGNGK